MKSKRPIELLILTIRGQRVILDADLAALYGVPTKRFNESFKRNRHRFQNDFCFQLTADEFAALRDPNSSRIAISSSQAASPNWSQFATSSRKHHGAAYRPWAFTEHGALQAANILRSERAVEMSLYVIRAFVKMREELAENATILKRLAEIDQTLLEHNAGFREVYRKLLPLLQLEFIRKKRTESLQLFLYINCCSNPTGD
ncbi:MAG: ORF6N domain-containing protein [Limisphaerales bacterium]